MKQVSHPQEGEPASGFKRNQQILGEAKPDGVIAFPGGTGTADMMERTRKAGIKLWMPVPA
jgi:hypothetical protein